MADPAAHANDVTTTRTVGAHGTPLTVTTPDGPAEAGVVVIQEAFGVAESLIDATRRIAAQGYIAVAPHLFHRKTDTPPRDLAAARPLMASLNGPDVQHDIDDARDYLDGENIATLHQGIVGFCMGGTLSLWQAGLGGFGASVTFYGGGIAKGRWRGVPAGLESGAALAMPWLGLYGDQDPTITTDDVEHLREVVSARPVPTDIVRYPDASHAFANDPASPRYAPEAAADAWARALSFFDAHLQ